jgi:AraC-like DNA-binding protein
MEGARIEDLTREFGLNRNKLCTGFRSLFGVSIFDFASGLRMDRAHRLLRESQLSVMEIALSVGYSSAGAFSSAFHRYFGFSPSEARGLSPG